MIKDRIREAFVEYMRVDRCASVNTILAYKRDLAEFSEWFPDDKELADVDLEFLEKYLTSRKGLKGASLARKATTLKRFFYFLALEEYIDCNPAEHLALPKAEKTLPAHLSIEEMQRLLDTAKGGIAYTRNREALALRDRTVVTLLYATGLRVSELVSLTPAMINFKERYIQIRGKGDKERITPFAPIVGQLLKEHIKLQGSRLTNDNQPIFSNPSGEQISRQAIFKMIKELAWSAGVPGDVSPHTFRHSYATHLLQSGMGLRSLQTLLGHSDLSTTQIYAHVTPEHLRIAQAKFHPRG